MLPCQTKAGKVRSRDKVVEMVLDALASSTLQRKASETTELGASKTATDEVREAL